MQHLSTDKPPATAGPALRLLRRGLALGLADVGAGRAELRQAAARFDALGDSNGSLLAHAALLVFISIADDDYAGFEPAAARVLALVDSPGLAPWSNPSDALWVEAGSLVEGSFYALDAPGLATRAAAIGVALANTRIAAPLRCCAGLTGLSFHQTRMDLAGLLWFELALRPLLTEAALGARLADEAFHFLVQSLYQCGAPAQASALRLQRAASALELLPVIKLKLLLLDAQIALGAGQAQAGAAALLQAEPLLDPRAPRAAGWWHLLRSRLDLLESRHRQALVHARLALRLTTASQLPERWMGVTVMQEGQVQMAEGAYLLALPFFERAGAAASGPQARFCVCLVHLARALHHASAAAQITGDDVETNNDSADKKVAVAELRAGLALARELSWLNFFRASHSVAAAVCALALEHGVEVVFVREVVSTRALLAARPDLLDWPWPIRLRTLGGLHIEINGQALAFKGKVAKKPLELLLFIVASGGADVSATSVAFALWHELDGDRAHAALTAALHRLRKLLGRDDAVLLELGRLSLNPQCVWVDCLAFEQLAGGVGLPDAAALPARVRAVAERAQALYSGPFLHGSDEQAWQLAYRSRLASKFKRMVSLLAQAALARGDTAAACAWHERALEFEPLAGPYGSARAALWRR